MRHYTIQEMEQMNSSELRRLFFHEKLFYQVLEPKNGLVTIEFNEFSVEYYYIGGNYELRFKSGNLRHCYIENVHLNDRELPAIDAFCSFFEGGVDFQNVTCKGHINFTYANFGDGNVNFSGANFGENNIKFSGTNFGRCNIDFSWASFEKGSVYFNWVSFIEGNVHFIGTEFGEGNIKFSHINSNEYNVDFSWANFEKSEIYFSWLWLLKGGVNFVGNNLENGSINFSHLTWGRGNINFNEINFGEGNLNFGHADLGNVDINLNHIKLKNGDINLKEARLIEGKLNLDNIKIKNGNMNFTIANFRQSDVYFTNIQSNNINFDNTKLNNCKFYNVDVNFVSNFKINSGKTIVFENCRFHDTVVLDNIQEIFFDNSILEKIAKITNCHVISLSHTIVLGNIDLNWEELNLKESFVGDDKTRQLVLIKENYHNLGQYDWEDKAFVEYMRIKRQQEKTCFKKIINWLIDVIGEYGTNPGRVAITMLLTWLAFGAVFEILFQNVFGIDFLGNTASNLINMHYGDGFYYSAITFLTMSYNIIPVHSAIKILAPIEGILGLFLMSYFTVALVRKTLR